MNILSSYRKIPLVYKMVSGMVLGVLIGIFLPNFATSIQPLGKFFLTLLKMVSLPLVIVNLLAGISSIDNPKTFGRIGGKIFVYYILTTALAMLVGSFLAIIIKPGVNLPLNGTYEGVVDKLPSVMETLVSLIPTNIFSAMVEGRFDQVVVVSAILGIAILLLPDDNKKRLNQLFDDLSKLMSKVVSIIMGLAPYGICALIASSISKYGKFIFGVLAKYIFTVYFGILCMCLIYATLVFIFTRISFKNFFKSASSIMITAFSTCSSTSSIPINIECADKLDVSRKVSSFTIPLGAQINKDGTGLTLSIVFVLTSQAIGVSVDPSTLIKVIVLGLILTTGSGAIPSGMLVILAVLLEALGFPLEIVGIVAGVHAFNDMGMTMINCLGDLAGTVIVDKGEKKHAR